MTVVIGYSAAISLRNALSCQYMNSEQHSDVVVLSYNDAQLRKGIISLHTVPPRSTKTGKLMQIDIY